MMLTLFLMQFFAAVLGEPHDVTVMYRLDDNYFTLPEYGNKGQEVLPSNSYDSFGWDVKWPVIESLETGVNVLHKGIKKYNVSSNRMSEFLPLDDYKSEQLYIKFPEADYRTKINLIISSHDLLNIADFYLLQLTDTYDQNVYRCGKDNSGRNIDIPGGKARNCVQQSGIYQIESTGKEIIGVKIVFSSNSIEMFDINNKRNTRKINLDFKPSFLTVGSLKPTYFEMSKGQYLWTLNEPRKIFVAGIEAVSSLCLTVTYYLQPGEDNYLHVLLKGSDEVLTLIAELPHSESNKVSTAQVVYRSSDSRGYVVIEGQKNKTSQVLVSRVAKCRDKDEVDVTLMDIRGTIEIHSRTNALGFPFMSQDKQIIDANVGADVVVCTAYNCSWDLSHWKIRKNFDDIPLPPITLENLYTVQETDGSNITSYRSFKTNEKVIFKPFGISGGATIYLLDELTDVTRGSMYGLRIYPGRGGFIFKCTQSTAYNYYYITNNYRRGCWELLRTNPEIKSWDANEAYSLEVETENSKISFTVKKQDEILEKLEVKDTNMIDIKHIACATSDVRGSFSFSLPEVYELDGNTGVMKSAEFVPSDSKICVSITSLISPHSEGVIEVTVDDTAVTSQFTVGRVPGQLEVREEGWRTDRFVAEIPPEFLQSHLRLQISASKPTDGHVLIQRISGCNAQDEEDVAVISHGEPLMIPANHGFHLAFRKNISEGTAQTRSPVHCYHGGVYDEEVGSCLCPVGFTGKQCKDGCGGNRYGDDCGGTCSSSYSECKNIIMCKPNMKCDCAPGFRGSTCDKMCHDGEYGVGCKQECGNCKVDYCDIYTGVCHTGCEHGYVAPFCKQELRHLISAPVVSTTSYYEASVFIDLSDDNLIGEGEPIFYQLQYKISEERQWLTFQPQPFPKSRTEPVFQYINNLKPGTSYDVRALLLCFNGDHSIEQNLPVTSFVTTCLVQNNVDYNISVSSVTSDTFSLQWQYNVDNDTMCEIFKYEVYRRIKWQWVLHEETSESYTRVTRLLPGSSHEIRIRAITGNGPVNYSPVFKVTLQAGVPDYVVNLQADTTLDHKASRVWKEGKHNNEDIGIHLTWQPPRETQGRVDKYIVSYQCIRYLSCDGCEDRDTVEVKTTSAVIVGLIPHARYSVSVAAVTSAKGPATNVFVTTPSAAPDIGALLSEVPVMNLTNSSFIVNWEEPEDCSKYNGYFYGYQYQLLVVSNSTIIKEESTQDTQTMFTELQPHTDYQVRIHLVTSYGYDNSHPLIINATTKSTVPGPVDQLVVYKRSRKMVGVRWSAPRHVSGTLQSFKLSYKKTGSHSDETSVMLDLKPCTIWPKSFCYTINKLNPNTRYSITVCARNVEVNEDGDANTISVTTVEDGVPGAPEDLQLLNHTQSTVTIEWKLPHFFNGIIRSFILNIEQTDTADSTDCCQYFPLQEVLIQSEQPDYSYQISNLSSASKYTISVSWKTVSLGPSSIISVSTRPAVLNMTETIHYDDDESTLILDGLNTDDSLFKGYLVLIQPEPHEKKIPVPPIYNTNLAQELRRNFKQGFYIIAEILPDEAESNFAIALKQYEEAQDGTFGLVEKPKLPTGQYKAILVKIREYDIAYSISYKHSQTIHIRDELQDSSYDGSGGL